MVPMIESAEEFASLRTSDSREEQRRATWDPAPVQVWWDVIQRFPDLRFWLAQNKTVPLEVLAVLMRDSDTRVRDMVARKRKASQDMLAELGRDSDVGIRIAVAQNVSASAGVLRMLAHDEDERVAAAALRRLDHDAR